MIFNVDLQAAELKDKLDALLTRVSEPEGESNDKTTEVDALPVSETAPKKKEKKEKKEKKRARETKEAAEEAEEAEEETVPIKKAKGESVEEDAIAKYIATR